MTIPGSHQSGRLNYRQRVYAFLLAHGPATVPQIVAGLGLTQRAVEDSLYRRLGDTPPMFRAVRAIPTRGSPRKVWDIVITAKG